MRWSKTVTLLEVHAEGEVGRIITGGVIDVPGATMLDKMNHINTRDDWIRKFTLFEPRGSAQMSVNLLLTPTVPGADAAFIVLQPDQAHAMSGSNCMCVTTALLETGMVAMTEPETTVVLETPAGLVTATAQCRDGKCERVSLAMVPAYVEQLDVSLDIPGMGNIRADIAFGGVYYALVDASSVGLEISRASARKLVDHGMRIKAAVNEQISVSHPEHPSLNQVSYVMFTAFDSENPAVLRGATIMSPGRCDRSPCGTGNAARAAVRYARGQVAINEQVLARSIIDSEFTVEVTGETMVGHRTGIMTHISGRAWIYGLHQLGVDPTDPWPTGYVLSDTWGPGVAATGSME